MRFSTQFSRLAMSGTLAAALAACSGGDDQTANSAEGATTGSAPTATAPAAEAAPPTGPEGWKLPMTAKALAPGDHDAIMKAAGFRKFGKIWAEEADSAKQGCSAGIDDALFDNKPSIRDLNGDGKPEVVVTDAGTYCYGNTGQGFAIVSWTGSGWKQLIKSSGIPMFIARKGSPWPDVEIGGPGFCFYRARWSGRDYSADGGWFYDGKPCKSPEQRDREEQAAMASPVPAAPAGQPKMVAGLPIPLGFYVLGTRCAGALANDGILVTPTLWQDADGDYAIKPVKSLGGGKYRLGEAADVVQITGPRSFIAEPGEEYQRVFTWCSATAPPR
jgi:hypothetical protein